jgi:glycosyltransferase involved in cell wall biosynthesis
MARVCLLLPSHWGAAKGGAELQAHLFSDYLARNTNHEVLYLTKRAPVDSERYTYQIRSLGNGHPQRFGMFWDASSLLRALATFKPDVIIQRVASAYTGIAAFYSRRHRAKLIWHVSSDRDVGDQPEVPTGRVAGLIDAALFRFGVRNATAVVTQTEDQARVFEQNYGRAADAVVPNFAVAPARAWDKAERFTVLWIANLKPLKRPELFVQLAEDLNQCDMSFKIIGRRDNSPWCDSILKQISLSRSIEFLGELELEDVNAQLERAHLLVNTSLYEGLPNTFIQAWLREVATITLGVDPDGMITASKLGYCAPTYDALKAQVLKYFSDRTALNVLATGARELAMERFSMNNAQALRDVIDGLLKSEHD